MNGTEEKGGRGKINERQRLLYALVELPQPQCLPPLKETGGASTAHTSILPSRGFTFVQPDLAFFFPTSSVFRLTQHSARHILLRKGALRRCRCSQSSARRNLLLVESDGATMSFFILIFRCTVPPQEEVRAHWFQW